MKVPKIAFAVSCAAALCWFAPQLRADVTLRYKSDLQMAPYLPAEAREQAEKALSSQLGNQSLQMKAGKAVTKRGRISSVVDFAKNEVTFLDDEHKTVASIPVSELPARMKAAMPPMTEETKRAMAAIKTSVDSKKTGRTDTILGIQADEREVTLSMAMPSPPGAAEPLPAMRMVMQIWTAKPEEAGRVPAIRELEGFQRSATYFMNPSAMIEKILANFPGMEDMLSKTLNQQRAGEVMLRMHMEQFLPFPPAVLQAMAAKASPGVTIDPNAPMMRMNYEVAEISTAPVDDSVFEIPAGYAQIGADEMLKGMMKPPQNPKPASTPGPVHKVGGGVSAPSLIHKVEPQYTEEARHANVEGTIVLDVVVAADGTPRDLKIVRSLRPDLDQKAMEAVRQWRFQPGQKEGKPVAVAARIEVNFRLLDNPPVPQN